MASGSSTWVSSTNGNSGSAQFACINGYWGAPSGGSCTAPPPPTTSGSLQCPGVGGNITWNSGASTCSAFVPAAAVSPGTYSYSSDNGTPGSYQRRCNGKGTWSDLGGTCGSAPPAAVPCPGGTLPWTVGAASCQATIPVSSAGSYTFSSTNGNAGVFTAQCNNDGTWGELGRTCELPPVTPVTCPSNGSYNTWTGTSGAICGGNMPANPVSPGLYTVNNTIATSMGSYTGRCQADGTWAPVFSECDPKTIQAPCAAQPFHTWDNCFGAGSGIEKGDGSTFTSPNQQAGYTGNADFLCDSGVWKLTASTCTAVATGCEGTRVEWENGSTGTAALTLRFNDSSDACVHAFDYASFFPGNCTAGPSGQCLFPSGMSISIQDATQPRTGSAQLRCTTSGTGIGVWVHSAAATCNSSGASGPITSWFATAGSNTTLTMMIPSSGGNGQFSMPWTGSTTDGSHHSVVLTEANRLANTGAFAGNWAPTFTPSGAIGVSGAVPQVLQGKNILNWWTNSCTPGDSRSVCQ